MEAGAPTLLRHAPPARRAAAPDSAQRALRPMPRYGSRKIEASPGRSGVTVSRRRVCRIMRENGLASAYARKRSKVHPGAVNEADAPSVVARGLGGRAPRTHICGDLAYVCVGASWSCARLLVDLYNRGSSATPPGPERTPGRSSRRSRRPPSRSRTSRYSTRTAAASSTTPRST